VCALAFHPYHPLICAADTRGFIKVGCAQRRFIYDASLLQSFMMFGLYSTIQPGQWRLHTLLDMCNHAREALEHLESSLLDCRLPTSTTPPQPMRSMSPMVVCQAVITRCACTKFVHHCSATSS
jgi:hypothetical protein